MQVKVDGVLYELVLPDDMNLGLQRKFQKIAGVGPDRLQDLVEGTYNPDVVVAWLAVSIFKAKPDTPLHEIEARLDELMPDELNEIWSNLVDEDEGDAGPPSTADGLDVSPQTSTGSSDAGSDAAPESRIRNGSGIPASPTGVASVPEILPIRPPAS